MARSYVSKTKFKLHNKEVIVKKLHSGRFVVTCKAKGGWEVTKTNLKARSAAAFILSCAQRKSRKDLEGPIKKARVRALLVGMNMKMSGIEWISLRMIHGARPIILKAPGLFRHRVIYIEPTGQPGTYHLRIVDPLTEHRTEPVKVSQEVVETAIRTFSHGHEEKEIQGR